MRSRLPRTIATAETKRHRQKTTCARADVGRLASRMTRLLSPAFRPPRLRQAHRRESWTTSKNLNFRRKLTESLPPCQSFSREISEFDRGEKFDGDTPVHCREEQHSSWRDLDAVVKVRCG